MKKFIVLSAIVASYFVLLVGSGGESAEDRAKKVATLKAATAEKLNMKELAEMFKLGSKATDLQRDAKEKEITGKVIEATFKVYEVAASGESCYRIQASSSSDAPGAFIKACKADAEGVDKLAAALKTGDMIKVKGIINGTSLRNLEISPALISK